MNQKIRSKPPKEVVALLAALQLCNSHTGALQQLTDPEWRALLSFCDLAHLTLPLQQLSYWNEFPDWVIYRLEKNASDNAKRFELTKTTYLEVAKALGNNNIKYLVFKGFTQYPDYVKTPRLRAQSDIDLYCPGDMIWRACSALMSIDYKPEQAQHYSKAADHLPAMFRDTGWKWRGNPFDPEMPLSIELHFCLWNEKVSRIFVPNIEKFWERRVTRSIDEFTFPCLNPVDHFGYCALHVLRNILLGDWVISHVYELATFLHSHVDDKPFWGNWRELHDDSLRQLEAISFCLARDWFGCDLSKEVESEISNLSPAIHQWIHRFCGSPLQLMFRPNKDRLWLHLCLLNSSQEKLAVFRKTLWPMRVPNLKTPAANLSYRRVRTFWPSHPYVRYVFYVISRLIYHLQPIPITLWNGFGWWISLERKIMRG